MSRSGFAIFHALSFVVYCVSHCSAAEKPDSRKSAETLVKEALHSEIYGLQEDRARLLEQARTIAPEFSPANWHSGRVRQNDEWKSIDQITARAVDNPKWAEYQEKRKVASPTADGQVKLAKWCAASGLPDQERAHLNRAIEADPNHEEAHTRLDHIRDGNGWTTKEAVQQERKRREELSQALTKWRPTVTQIRTGLKDRDEAAQRRAQVRLDRITDGAAIWALEEGLANDSELTALKLIAALSNIAGTEASLALARQAVFSPWSACQQLAVEKLKSRPEETYIPTLLAAMQSPAKSEINVYLDDQGRIRYQHMATTEGRDADQVVVFDEAYRRAPRVRGSAQITASLVERDIERKTDQRESALEKQNSLLQQLNERINWVLTQVTGDKQDRSPQQWWDWWTKYNEYEETESKPTTTTYRRSEYRVADYVPAPPPPPLSFYDLGLRPPPRKTSCFAAGTPVWTLHGPKPIDEIYVGDLVLSQHPETGELTYKAVLDTTLRPPVKMVVMEVGSEKIESTGGHMFWQSGKGWLKARKLPSGTLLHSVTGAVPVSYIDEAGPTKPAHNLVVEDFHTYFVGNEKLLAHDNTYRNPTRAIVPGLIAE